MNRMDPHELYSSPLVSRNATHEMCVLFGQRQRVLTWRRLWLALAQQQRRLGVPISAKQIAQLKATLEKIDFRSAQKHEARLRHDVMAHLHAWGEAAPLAKPILHLGATSADIVDNADLIIMREALEQTAVWLANVIDALGWFAHNHRSMPTLGLTHYQPAQLTTVGKRAAMWCSEFVNDLAEVEHRIRTMRFRGFKGATGTQASFMDLLGDRRKVLALERSVASEFGFTQIEPVTGQTYTRKVDAQVVSTLAQIAASVHKLANDIRLLSGRREIEEPFESEQVGSSSMPYKRNPMRCERATGLARLVISLVTSPLQTAAEQWFERTLDDSSNKRITIPEAFLAIDGMLKLVTNVARGLVVHPKVIEANVRAELPQMATEAILMAGVVAGGDRQKLHERIRRHARAASQRVTDEGAASDLLERLQADEAFAEVDFEDVTDPRRFTGLAIQQTLAFVREYVEPIRRRYRQQLRRDAELTV